MGKGGKKKREKEEREVEMRKERERQQTLRIQSSELKDLLQCQQYRILDMGYVQLIRTAGMDRVKTKALVIYE